MVILGKYKFKGIVQPTTKSILSFTLMPFQNVLFSVECKSCCLCNESKMGPKQHWHCISMAKKWHLSKYLLCATEETVIQVCNDRRVNKWQNFDGSVSIQDWGLLMVWPTGAQYTVEWQRRRCEGVCGVGWGCQRGHHTGLSERNVFWKQRAKERYRERESAGLAARSIRRINSSVWERVS